MNDVAPVSPVGQRMVLISGAFAAITVTMSALQLIKGFQAMAQLGFAGVGSTSILLWEIGRPALIGLVLTTLIALAALAVCAARRNTLSLPPVWVCLLSGFLTLLPGALLYAAAVKVFEVVAAPAAAATSAADIGSTSALLARLLISSTALGLLVPLVLLLLAFLLKPRPGSQASWVVWGAVCAIYLGLLVHLFTRLSWLHEVAVRGSL